MRASEACESCEPWLQAMTAGLASHGCDPGGGGGGVLPYTGLMGTCGQPGYVFRDFFLEQGIEFIIFCLYQGIDLSICVLNWVKCLKQGIKNRNSVLKWVGKSAIFVVNRVRV